jgi:hypothetical protein
MLVHHVRKGEATNIDAARGAKALTDSARVGLLLTTMTAPEAETFGVPEEERQKYIRLDDVKRNMAPAGRAEWFYLAEVPLENREELYPNGDNVAAITAWEPTSVWDKTSEPELNTVLNRIDAGMSDGGRYTDSRRHPATRWAGHVIIKNLGVSEKQAVEMISTWIKNGTLVREEYRDRKEGKDKVGLSVNATRRPGGVT